MLREMSEEIKMLKAMLEGKMPIHLDQISHGNSSDPIVQEKIIYRNAGGDNKENNDALEEELRNKDERLKM